MKSSPKALVAILLATIIVSCKKTKMEPSEECNGKANLFGIAYQEFLLESSKTNCENAKKAASNFTNGCSISHFSGNTLKEWLTDINSIDCNP